MTESYQRAMAAVCDDGKFLRGCPSAGGHFAGVGTKDTMATFLDRSSDMTSAHTAASASATSAYTRREFWERLWRTAGIQFVAFFVVTAFIYGIQPNTGASAEQLNAFYHGDRTRILIAVSFSGLNLLNLLWFASALRTTLTDAGQDGWGTSVITSSAVFGGLTLLALTINAALAFSIAASGNIALTSALNDFTWALVVLTSFPRAMLIMSGAFGLWRAGLISNALFGAGVAAVILGVLGGTTWLSGGFWAPDGAYTRLVSPLLLLVWIVVVSRVLSRGPATRGAW